MPLSIRLPCPGLSLTEFGWDGRERSKDAPGRAGYRGFECARRTEPKASGLMTLP
ncbi:hypothetical protein [Lysobacter gummosus]|uniref:hypothetical protein n=1 Tax=Lysobacter gummosus TaxID=262324 RepID=UPI003639A0F6